jgi:glycine/D-amino acid oxidase-like deaminating enzyme/nitrite reductase/ring-hydroxylating ferredoxin subunit
VPLSNTGLKPHLFINTKKMENLLHHWPPADCGHDHFYFFRYYFFKKVMAYVLIYTSCMKDENANHSIWMKVNPHFTIHELKEDKECEVCIIGAGIAGLTTAYLLSKMGKKVIVLEKFEPASGESSRTTAHFVNVLDDRFYNLNRYHGLKKSALALQSHTDAISKVEQIVIQENIDCDFKRVDGYLFKGNDRPEDEIKKEFEAMQKAGLPLISLEENAPIKSFATGECIKVKFQAKLHPLKYLAGLAQAIEKYGGIIYSNADVTEIEDSEPLPHAKTSTGIKVKAKAIVVATNTPVNNMFEIHTRQNAYRTYVMSMSVPADILEDALYWDTADPYHYIRIDSAEGNEDEKILTIGGEDHKTGQNNDTQECFTRLEKWIRDRFPVREVLYQWSGQVMEPNDGLAFIGRNTLDKHIYIITGDSGNGMTHGTLGGILITDLITGKENPWEKVYTPRRLSLLAAGQSLKELANMVLQYADWLTPGDELDDLQEDEGMVIRRGIKKYAVYKNSEHDIIAFDATCTHLGCVVNWNTTEKTWDCPCHGSRFSKSGEVINGPALTALKHVESAGIIVKT